jgi:hypothetical protein
MTKRSRKSAALHFAALLGIALIQPFGAAFAAAPNEVNNQEAINQMAQVPAHGEFSLPSATYSRGTSVYDRFDQFKTEQGFPRPGDSQLFFPVN